MIFQQRVPSACFFQNQLQLDQAVGRILAVLDTAGFADNTIVIFTTEHGPPIARAKHTLYDSGIRTRWSYAILGRLALACAVKSCSAM